MVWMLLTVAGAALGGLAGTRLARHGVTAANALEGRQGLAYLILVGVAGGAATVYFRHRLTWLPAGAGLYAEAAVFPVANVLAGFALGLLLLLEWPGRADRSRRRSAIIGGVLIAGAIGYLGFRSLPVRNVLGPSAVIDGVVIQTSAYTCAPASIATLARVAFSDTTFTEAQITALARTTREGTTTLGELRAMRLLGLSPRFANRLTTDSLVAHDGLALLHVDEPILATRIRHAVALLAVDPVARTITVGNPLYGRQVKGFDELEGYWLGEAVLVGVQRRQ